MSQLSTPLDIYKLLPKSNCKACGVATCLAFAAAVIKGEKRISECSQLQDDLSQELDEKIIKQPSPEEQLKQVLVPLKKNIASVDFSASVQRLGASLTGNKLTIKSLGKDFTVDPEGTITSPCHINVWVTAPLLSYIIDSSGKDPSGKWVPFRELSHETVWDAFFEQRFEKPLKQLTDSYPDLIEDMIYIFNGKHVESQFNFDISLVLHPLPKLPILICYTKPSEDLPAKLNVFFDTTAQDNLKVDSIYRLCVGLLTMFQKIASNHV